VGCCRKPFSRLALDQRRLGELVDLIAGIGVGSTEHREKDVLGRVYEYFIGRFASAEGKGGGEFYAPSLNGEAPLASLRGWASLDDR
jgi:type I restriction enzyme M protein